MIGLPWGVLLLFGGGLALAAVIQSIGLAEGIIALMVLAITFLTEVTSNMATAAAFLPLLAAVALGLLTKMITIPAATAASCAFMLPVATPVWR